MQIAFVFPGITTCGFNSFGKKNGIESNYMIHGVGSISAVLKEKGHQCDLLDLRCLKDWDDFDMKVKNFPGKIFAVTTTSESYRYAEECFERIKKVRPDSIVVVGGVHPTVATDEVAANPNIDYVIRAEGEISFPELLEKIEAGTATEKIIDGKTPHNLDDLPFVDRELFNYTEGELNTPWMECLEKPFITIITSRGCAYNCSFCQPAERQVFGGVVRRRSVDNVIAELKHLHNKYSFKSFFIHDDNFLTDPEYILEFVEKFKKTGIKAEFVCQARADFVCRYPEIMKQVKEIGLIAVMIGLESGSQRILNFIRKGTKVEQNYKAAKICKANKIQIFANYMFGVPTETKWEALKTLFMIWRISPEHPSPSFFTPYPSSDLYTYCVEKNILLMDKSDYDSYRRSPSKTGKVKGINYKYLQVLALLSYGLKNIPSIIMSLRKK